MNNTRNSRTMGTLSSSYWTLNRIGTGLSHRICADSGGAKSSPERRTAIVAFVAVATVLAISAVGVCNMIPNRDVSYNLYVSGRILNGAGLYRDIIEINPPLIFWIGVPFAWMNHQFGIDAVPAFNAFVYASILISLRFTYANTSWLSSRPRLLLLLFATTAFAIMPRLDFGQREHIFSVFFFPYIALSVVRCRWEEARSAKWIGLMGGVGIALKPHFILYWIAADLFVTYRSKVVRMRPESLVLAGFLLLYWLLVLFLTPEWVNSAARVAALYIPDRSVVSVLIQPMLVMILCAVIFGWVDQSDREWRSVRHLLLLESTIGVIVGTVQMLGFRYHFLPAGILGFVVFAMTSVDLTKHMKQRWSRMASALTAALIVASTIMFAMPWWGPWFRGNEPERAYYGEMAAILRPYSTVAFLTAGLHNAFPTLQMADVEPALPMPSLWYLNVYRETSEPMHVPATMSSAEHYYWGRTIDALLQGPDVIVVDEAREPFGIWRPFDIKAYFEQDPRVLRLFDDYGRIATYRSCAIYVRGRANEVPPPSAEAEGCAAYL